MKHLKIDTTARIEAWVKTSDLRAHPLVQATLKSGDVEQVMNGLEKAFFDILTECEYCEHHRPTLNLHHDFPQPEGLHMMALFLLGERPAEVAS